MMNDVINDVLINYIILRLQITYDCELWRGIHWSRICVYSKLQQGQGCSWQIVCIVS